MDCNATKMFKTTLCRGASLLLFGAFCGGAALSAHAVYLPIGIKAVINGVTNAGWGGALSGTVIATTYRDFTINTANGYMLKGRLQDCVVRENATGTLDFYVKVLYVSPANDPFTFIYPDSPSVIRSDMHGFSVNADYRLDSSGVSGPSLVSRFYSFFGDSVRFDWQGLIGYETHCLMIKTNAKNYSANGSLQLFMATGATVIPGYQPVP